MKKVYRNQKETIKTDEIFDVDLNNGLSATQVEEMVKNGLTNKTKKSVTKTYWQIIRSNLLSYFNILLFIIAGFMFYFQLYDGMFFMLVLASNIVIGFFQDIRARIKTDKLKLITAAKCTVIRGGNEISLETDKIVQNELIILKNGEQICVDGKIVDGQLSVNESLLTGESDEIIKKPGDFVLSGSYVTSGYAKIVALKVGLSTYTEKLRAKASQFRRPNSEILYSIKKLFNIICTLVTIFGVAMIVIDYFLYLKPGMNTPTQIVKGISGSMVSMIPSGMYLLTSLALAAGVLRLAYNKMLVQELYCIETLARVDTICFDKTGTLTTGNMTVDQILLCDEKITLEEVRNHLKTLLFATRDSNSTAKAINRELEKYHCFASEVKESHPFSSTTKKSSVVYEDGTEIIMGAIEFVFDQPDKGLVAQANNFAQRGLRTLVVARKSKILKIIKPLALISLSDEINCEAKETLEWFKDNDVKIKIISGDNIETVRTIAREIGINDYHLSVDLSGKTNEEVKELANTCNIFGRVTPEQKDLIIGSLKEKNHTVAMTGDGVNDILALKHADCSIAMSSGSDAVKDMAYMVALDSNFSSLPKVVYEGRRVINNLQRTCSLFLVKTCFAFAVTLFFLILQLINPEYLYPFSTNNMYLWEILTIGVGAFLLALQKNSERIKGSFIKNIISKAIPAAICQVLFVFVIYLISFFNNDFLSLNAANASAVICYSVFSFVIFSRVCMPFDKYRTIVLLALIGMCSLIISLDYVSFVNPEFKLALLKLNINYDSLSLTITLLTFGLIILMIPIYYLLCKFFDRKVR